MNRRPTDPTDDPEFAAATAPDDSAPMGDVKINHSVVASIVRLAALEVSGVHSVGAGLVDGLTELFKGKESDRGVRVSESPSGAYVIEIRVVVRFGEELGRVALAIQQRVREMVAKMTLRPVGKVDVIIEGVKLGEKRKPVPEDMDEWHSGPQTD